LFFGIQWTENNILIPRVMNKTLWVSPLLILICMLIGSSILWFLWILLAIPLAVVLTVFFETLS
jgi:predicted PurR-regulated permease PerM